MDIRVVQEARQHGSRANSEERPLPGRRPHTSITHRSGSDTIEWIVKNVRRATARWIIGISYDGCLALMALVNPHPAFRCRSRDPMVDGWIGTMVPTALPPADDAYTTRSGARRNEARWWTALDDATVSHAGEAGEWGGSAASTNRVLGKLWTSGYDASARSSGRQDPAHSR